MSTDNTNLFVICSRRTAQKPSVRELAITKPAVWYSSGFRKGARQCPTRNALRHQPAASKVPGARWCCRAGQHVCVERRDCQNRENHEREQIRVRPAC